MNFLQTIFASSFHSINQLLWPAQLTGRQHLFSLLCVALLVATVTAEADIIDELQPGHWAAISLNKLTDVNPCPGNNCSYTANEGQSAVINDWNGGAFATGFSNRGGLVVFGGGHKGYYGNEIYVFDLDNRLWIRASEPVQNPSCNYGTGDLQDGSPCSPHTYDYVDYHPLSNSFVKLGSASNHEQGGGGASKVHLFSFDTRTWRGGASNNYPNFLSHTGASSAYDPNRGVFWLLPAYNRAFMKYDPSANGGSGLWTPYSVYNIDIDAVSAIDPNNDIFVTLDSRGTRTVIAHDLKNPGARGVTVNTTGDKSMESSSRPGFEWDPTVNSFVAWGSGASVYKLTPPSGDWKSGTWVWQRVDPAPGNTVTPSSPNPNGTYSRFRYAPSVNAYVVVNRSTDNVYMYKLSAGAGVPAPAPTSAPSGDDDADWIERSTAPGVVMATRFDTQAEVTDGRLPDGAASLVSWDSSFKKSGSGSLRFDIPKTAGANAGNWRGYLRDDQAGFHPGSEFYVQYRQYFPRYLIEHRFAGGGGWKSSIVSGSYMASNTANEIVVQNSHHRGYVQGYHQDGKVTAVLWDAARQTACSSTDFVHQPAIDRGSNPLIGTSPDGNAWTACEQDRARYGGLYSFGNSSIDPISGAFKYPLDGWLTILQRIRPGAWGSPSSTIETWAAADGEDYTLLYSSSTVTLGAPVEGRGFEALWLLPYNTGRQSDSSRQDTSTWYDEVIVSTNFIPAPGGAPQVKPNPPTNLNAQ